MKRLYFKDKSRSKKTWVLILAVTGALLLGGVAALRIWYDNSLKPVSKASTQSIYYTVETGSSLRQIAAGLQRAGLIRSVQAFETYVRSNELHDNLQAGTYVLSPAMSVQEIVEKMSNGEVAKNLLTILPGKRIDQIKEVFLEAGYSQPQIEAAFDPAAYRDHPILRSLPAGASFEGYLYPDSFQKEVGTPAEVIIRKSLDEMQKHLTADIINGFSARGLSVYEGITLASIILKETDDPKYQPIVAQVLLTRLERDMMLESDPTAFYASERATGKKDLQIDSPYNTYRYKGLPPGPIASVTESALIAAAKPASSDYLFFVAGDDGRIYFSQTREEHEKAVRQYCIKGCS